MKLQRLFVLILLSDQGSNLDSSDPESDVLPVTPSDIGDAKIQFFLKNRSMDWKKNQSSPYQIK